MENMDLPNDSLVDLNDESDSDSDHEEEPTPATKKRRGEPTNRLQTLFKRALKKYNWVKDDQYNFLGTGNVHCCVCPTEISICRLIFDENGSIQIQSYQNSSGNLSVHAHAHAKTKHHHDMVKLKGKVKIGKIDSHFSTVKRGSEDDFSVAMGKVISLTQASIVAEGVNPNLIEKLFDERTTASGQINQLTSEKSYSFWQSQSCSKQHENDRRGEEIREKLKLLLAKEPLALITDAASLKRDSAIAVMASCAK
jgi:hypothetical protein